MANENKQWQPEKIVIQAGPTFGASIGFVLFGASLGAAITALVLRKDETSTAAASHSSLRETEQGAARLRTKLTKLAVRVKDVAGRARDAAQIVNENVRPAIQAAVAEGRNAAREVEAELREEIEGDPKVADEQA